MRQTAFLKRVRNDQSRKFLNQFSRANVGRDVNIKLIEHHKMGTIARGLPLLGLTAEPPHGRIEDVLIVAGDPELGQVEHRIHHPKWIGVSQIEPRKRQTMWLTSMSGSAVGIHWDPNQDPEHWSWDQWE